MKIVLEPTSFHEVFNGQSFRLFKGITDSGIKVQMLGMFRVEGGELSRAAFMRHLAETVKADEQHPTLALDGDKLIRA